MAGEQPSSKSHRKHAGTSVRPRKSHKRPRCDESAVSTSATAERQPDLDALRKARLEYLENLPEERRSTMKYVYDAPIPSASQTTKERKSDRRSTVSTTRRKPEDPKRHRRRRTEGQDKEAESDTKYVYRPVREVNEDVKSRPSKPATRSMEGTVRKPERGKSGTRKATPVRGAPKRRHTEPLERINSCEDDDKATEVTATIPPRQRTNPAVSGRHPPLKRSATIAAARTEVSLAKSAATSPNERRNSGLFSGFLLPKPPMMEKKVSCLTCGAGDVPVSKSAKLPCKHRMCHSCLRRIFKMSITDPAHMPPRCCTDQHIDLKHVDKLFDQNFKKTWNRKFLEYKTKNKIYCIGKNCGEWIKPHHITIEHGRKIGKCKRCGTKVCAICNNKAHTSRDCPKDPALKQFIETAKQKGWQKCYNCSAMVELKEGCNHMTCRCTAEFCMVCGLKWKSCDCPWFNYEAVDAHLGNPIRYQEELERRREQEQRDQNLARRMQALGVDDDDLQREEFAFGNAAGHHMNQNFIQQAREALTANYQNAEQAARGLLNNWYTGRENPLPAFPAAMNEFPQLLMQQSQRQGDGGNGAAPTRRGTNRRRSAMPDLADIFGGRSQTTEEREQERRIQEWANGVAAT